MINTFGGLLRRECSTLSRFFTKKNSTDVNVTLHVKNFKSFSGGSYHCRRYHNPTDEKKQLPNLFFIQNPITWLINKIDFIMLKSAWDPEFVEEEFKRGVKQAVSVICTLISDDLWSNLGGLVTSKTLARLQRDVKINWREDLKKNLAMEPSDIKLVLPGKVHFLRIADQKFVDVDVICVAMKFREPATVWNNSDIIIIEILARFHRNYTAGQLPNWTVTMFKMGDVRFQEECTAGLLNENFKNFPLNF